MKGGQCQGQGWLWEVRQLGAFPWVSCPGLREELGALEVLEMLEPLELWPGALGQSIGLESQVGAWRSS